MVALVRKAVLHRRDAKGIPFHGMKLLYILLLHQPRSQRFFYPGEKNKWKQG